MSSTATPKYSASPIYGRGTPAIGRARGHVQASREAETSESVITCGATEETNDKEPDYDDNASNLEASLS